jgi:hypothetical protein
VFDIKQTEYNAPEGGYFNPEFILSIKGFKAADVKLFYERKVLL